MIHLAVSDEWGSLRRGDPCRVEGLRGEWRFTAYEYSHRTGSGWVRVTGGRNRAVRQFKPERIKTLKGGEP